MAAVTIRGSLLPFLQETVYDFDPLRGYIEHQRYRGASQAQMLALQQLYVADGIACRLTFNQGDTATLEIEDSTQTYTIDSWEIVGNKEARDGLSHPAVLAVATDDEVALMRTHLANNDTPDVAFADTGLSGLAGGIAQRFYSLQQRGSTEYRRSQYVLRHTTNVPNRWTVNIADVGVDCIYTPAQLITEITNSSLWIFPCPPRLVYKISNIPAATPHAYYQWGWLKDGSTETTAANNRVNIVTEYCLELWSTDLYAPF